MDAEVILDDVRAAFEDITKAEAAGAGDAAEPVQRQPPRVRPPNIVFLEQGGTAEDLSDEALEAVTVANIAATYHRSWARLTVKQRMDRAEEFASTFEPELVDPVRRMLSTAITKKALPGRDVEYDEAQGRLLGVPRLKFQDGQPVMGPPVKPEPGAARARTSPAPKPSKLSKILAKMKT